MDSTCTQSTKSSSIKTFAPKPIRRSGGIKTSKGNPKCPFALSSDGKRKSESLFDLCSEEDIEKDFKTFKSDAYQAQREILSIISNSSNENFFDEDRAIYDEPIPERVKNPFFKNLE